MKLYGAIASPYVTRVMMFAQIKKIDLPLEDVPGGTPRSDEYRKITPIGKIPAFEVDGRYFAESEVICEYLEDAFPDPTGMPGSDSDRATSRLISRITDLYIAPHTSTMFRMMNPANRDPELVSATATEIAKGFGFVEHYMGPGPFCVGSEPSLGDCALAPYTMLLKKTVFPAFDEVADPTETDGRIRNWWQAVLGNPDCAQWIDEYGTAVDGFMKGMGARITGQASS